MSQSPTDQKHEQQTRQYLAGWEALHRLIREGKSISGRERHCCYLNLGSNHFADVSAVTGLDLADDGRAVCLSDWDHDGDEDVWIVNRTSPAIRFLRNDQTSGNRHLAVRLVGRECNRDAIGARVELFTSTDGKPWSVKTTRAGNGFLAQSSQWLHFGLGMSEQVDRLVVHWPGGQAETFRQMAPNRRYRIVQGSGKPAGIAERSQPVELPAAAPVEPVTDTAFRLVTMPTSAPRLENREKVPTLIVLWAGWCQPCLQELHALTRRQDALRAAGLRVLAVNIDDVDARDDFDSRRAEGLLAQLQFPFPHTRADEKAMETFQTARQAVADKPGAFALPTSFLIDWEGRVRVVYQGGVDVDQVLADLGLFRATPHQLLNAAVPFAGKWQGPPPQMP